MTLVIDPRSEKGKAYIEAIGWAQEQMNAVLSQYFNNKYRLMKGLKFQFNFKTDIMIQQRIKVEVFEMAPETPERLEEAVKEAKANIVFNAEIVKGGPMISATPSPVPSKIKEEIKPNVNKS